MDKNAKKILLFFLGVLILFISPVYSEGISDLSSLISSEGKVLFGSEQNSILVIDYPSNIRTIEKYLEMVDVYPQQVLIEARVVEVKLQGEHALGIRWEAFTENGGFDLGQFKGGSAYPGAPGVLSQAISYKDTYWPPTTSTSSEDPFSLAIFDDNINVVLQVLANSLDTNILSAPRIATVNNYPANIKIVQDVPWAEPSVENNEGIVSVTWNVNFEEIGIILNVTPTINEDNKITMVLEPEISEHVSDFTLEVYESGLAEPIEYAVPIIDKRTASTKIVVGNGQTLIIGGLIKDKRIKEETKIPLLGDLPILGSLFKSTRKVKDKTELLIFVSPTIISEKSFARSRQEEQRLGGWYREKKKIEQAGADDSAGLDKRITKLFKKQKRLVSQRKKLERQMEE
ncbi:MAG: type II secretion system protein GspD [Candidatus Omnitrophica bacterium]|nr:type II secretion system protein GspD [Candidatus Omnitrophota bacterium]